MRNWSIEFPSIEHPDLLALAIEESRTRGVPIHRVDQASGIRMLSEGEVRAMTALARDASLELILSITTRSSWDPRPDAHAGDQLVGEGAFASALVELRRCVGSGAAGVAITDVGLLAVAGELARSGELDGLRLKTGAAIAPRNAAAARLYEQLGATSINVMGASTVEDLAAMREVLGPDTTLDVYVESPDQLGGGLRYHELPEIVRAAAPVMLKIGLRHAPRLFMYGEHLKPVAEQLIRERVRRTELVIAELDRAGV
jgi:hypothetical protein